MKLHKKDPITRAQKWVLGALALVAVAWITADIAGATEVYRATTLAELVENGGGMVPEGVENVTVTTGETLTEIVFDGVTFTVPTVIEGEGLACPTTCTMCCGCVEKGMDPVHWREWSSPTSCGWKDVYQQYFIWMLE